MEPNVKKALEAWELADSRARAAKVKYRTLGLDCYKAESAYMHFDPFGDDKEREMLRLAALSARAAFESNALEHDLDLHQERYQWAKYARSLNESQHKETIHALAEIRDLLTKMANPPIMVSLESTPESRAASRDAKREAAEHSSHIGQVVQQIAESTKKVYDACKEASPVSEGSEAADERDRALGRKARQAMLEKGFLDASADAGWYLHLLRRVIRMSALTVETCPAGYPDVADFLREEAGRT